MVADYTLSRERGSRFNDIMYRGLRIKEKVSCGECKRYQQDREWFRGARMTYWWQSPVEKGPTEDSL